MNPGTSFFATGDGAPLDHRVVVRRHFKSLLKSAGLPQIRPYDLRHTSATLDLRNGVPIKVVSERLGHSTAKMTLDVYQHVSADMQRQAADAMEELLFAKRAKQVLPRSLDPRRPVQRLFGQSHVASES